MIPSVGRIVHYQDSEGKTLAAVVVAVVDNVVNLAVWNEFGRQFTALNVKQGNCKEHWDWPPRT